MISRITLIIILLLTALPCYGLEVSFKTNAVVSGVSTTLGDIAELSDNSELAIALSTKIVSPSPAPGQVTSLDSRQIISKLIKENGPLSSIFWKGSSGVAVKRDSITINSRKVLEIIDAFISENRNRLPKADITFKPESLPLPFLLPTGALTWDVIPSSPGIIGSSRFTIICKINDRVRKNFSVRGHIEAMAPVVVAKRRLKYGEIVTPDLITLSPRDLSKIDNYIMAPDMVIGSAIKRAVNAGSAVDSDAIEQPPVIRRGEFVKIIITHNGLVLTATGIAKNNGKKDEIIRVKNTSSNKLVFCRVHAPGLVEVRI